MARAVDADIFIRDLTAMKKMYDAIELDGMIKVLKEAPTIDTVKHGKWMKSIEKNVDGDYWYECSECSESLTEGEYINSEWNYCPVCGARMDGE